QRLRMGEHRIVWRIQLQVVPAVVPGPGNGAREQIAGRLATADVGLGAARQWTFQTDRLEVTVWRLALQARIHPSLVGEGYPELRCGQWRDTPVRIGGHGPGVTINEMGRVVEQLLSVGGQESVEQHEMVDPLAQPCCGNTD